MKANNKAKLSITSLAFAGLLSVSVGFLETHTGLCKGPPRKQQPAVLSASAIAVADKYGADAAEQIFKEGRQCRRCAAVAIAFTLAVTYPEAGNIGGGGFMTLYVNGKPYFIDYREACAARRDPGPMYLDDQGNVIKGKSLYGYYAVGVPGTVAGHVGSAAALWQAEVEAGACARNQICAGRLHRRRAALQARVATGRRRSSRGTNELRYVLRQPERGRELQAARSCRCADAHRETTVRKSSTNGKTADLIAASMRGHGPDYETRSAGVQGGLGVSR